MWKRGTLTFKRCVTGLFAGTPEPEGAVKIDCSFDIIEISDFREPSVELRLGSGPPNKTVSRGLPGERRRVVKVESRQRSLVMLKQVIISHLVEP